MRELFIKSLVVGTVVLVAATWFVASPFADGAVRLGSGFTRPFAAFWALLDGRLREGFREFMPAGKRHRLRSRDVEERIQFLELELARTRAAVHENRELRSLLGMPPPDGWYSVAAPIMLRDPVFWNRRFRLARGARDGLVAGAVVVAGGAVVGRVLDVTATTASVVTVADPACHIGVLVGENMTHAGILAGLAVAERGGGTECRVTFLPRDGVYAAGDPVYTSSLGGNMPGGLLVGHLVADPQKPAIRVVDSAYAEGRVLAAADLDGIGIVAVLCRRDKPGAAAGWD